MEHVAFLGSGGAIVAPYSNPRRAEYAAYIPVAPYVETVYLPVVSVDSAALFGEHPEKLATLTYSSGAALTFYCDSVAGGTNTSGAGTFDDPWRSLNTALRFLSCNACILKAAAPYTQLKVKGTVDYRASVAFDAQYTSNFIIRGWGEKCDLAVGPNSSFSPPFGYFFDVRISRGALSACSNCTIISARLPLAVDCGFEGIAALTSAPVGIAYNCSGGAAGASICYGGSFGGALITRYAYAPKVTASDSTGLYLSAYNNSGPTAAVGASVAVSNSNYALGISAGGTAYLADCTVSATVAELSSSSETIQVYAHAVPCYGRAVISGGTWYASAGASAIGGWGAGAYASATFYDYTVNGATVTLLASAHANITDANGSEWSGEWITSGGTTCSDTRERRYSSGTMYRSSAWSGCTS